MTPKQRNIAILGVIAVAGVGFLYYNSKKNEAEGTALLDFINDSITQNDQSKAADEGIAKTRNVKVDPNRLAIGALKGPYKTPAIRDAVAKTVTGLWASMQGGGTNVPEFMKWFAMPKDKNTMAFIDQIFKAQHKIGLFERMKEETPLHNSQFGRFSDKTNGVLDTVPFMNSYWAPPIGALLNALPEYK